MEKDYYDDQNTMHDPCSWCGNPIGVIPGSGRDCTYCNDPCGQNDPICHYCEEAEGNEPVLEGPLGMSAADKWKCCKAAFRDGCDCDKCITPIGWKEYALGVAHSLLVLAIIALIVSIWFR